MVENSEAGLNRRQNLYISRIERGERRTDVVEFLELRTPSD
jgi:hypothetical protein